MAGRDLFATTNDIDQSTVPENKVGRNLFAQLEPMSESPIQPSIVQPEPTTEKPKVEPDFMGAGFIEPAAAVVSGLAGQVAGGLTGLASIPFAGVSEAAKMSEQISSDLTFEPRTESGKQGLETLGELVQSGMDLVNFPLSGLAGLLELISGQGLDQAKKTIADVQEKGIGKVAGDRVFDITGDPLMATIAGTSPEIVGSLMPITAMVKKRSALKQKIADNITSGGTDKALADYIVTGSGRLKKDKLAQESIKQGFDQSVISAVKGSTKLDRSKMLEMVNIMKKGKENALFSMKNRPSDIVGNSLIERVNHVKLVNRSAGKELDKVAKSLKGQQVEFDSPINNFIDSLDDIGVKLDSDFKPNYAGSDIEGLKAPQSAINNIINRLSKDTKGVKPDAYDLHRMKKFIDEVVTYGKAGEGLAGVTERMLKKLRRDLDQALDSKFPEYDKVNTQYSDTIGALDLLQDAAGKKIDLFGVNADKATGVLLRRLMSNIQSRINLVDAVDQIEVIAKKYGGKFDDDISTQMLFADELDSVFGSVARTSLAGEVGKGVKQAGDAARGQQTITGLAVEAAAFGAEKLRGINQENAFKSILELLKRE